jgi:hypothetical protein
LNYGLNMTESKPKFYQSSQNLSLNSFLKVSGVCAILAGALIEADLLVFALFPQPMAILDWFKLFQGNWIVGLLDLDLLGIIAYALCFPLVIALHRSLCRERNQLLTSLAAVTVFVGIAVYYASNTCFSLLSVSNQYWAATSDAQRMLFLASGETLLAMFFQTAFGESFIIVSSGLLLISILMLRSKTFGKNCGIIGVIANIAGLAFQIPLPDLIPLILSFIKRGNSRDLVHSNRAPTRQNLRFISDRLISELQP